MFERFTKKARAVVEGARDAALARGDGHVGPEHLLLALAAPGAGLASEVLAEGGVHIAALLREVETRALRPSVVTAEDLDVLSELGIDAEGILQSARQEPSTQPAARAAPHVPYTKTAKKSLELSLREAIRLKDNYIGTEHLLLGLLRQEGTACELLTAVGADLDALRQAAVEVRPGAA